MRKVTALILLTAMLMVACNKQPNGTSEGSTTAMLENTTVPEIAVTAVKTLLPETQEETEAAAPPQSPNTLLPQIMHDGIIYYLEGSGQMDIEFELAENHPAIRSTVPLSQVPNENGQANFNVEVGAPYTKYEDGVAVLWNNAWWIFVPPNVEWLFDSHTGNDEEKEQWVDVYYAILNGDNELDIDFYNYDLGIDGAESRRYNGCGLYDLDKDGTPELYVCIVMWEGSFYHIFTCNDGKGVYVGQVYGRFVEKSTGMLFNAFDEAGYTPDIAYKYSKNGITEIPDYVQTFYETDGSINKPKVKVGDTIYDYPSDSDFYFVSIYDDLEWAITNQEVDY